MRNINVEKFLADYDAVLKEKENLIANKDKAIENAKFEAEKICAEHEGYEAIKDKLVEIVVAEKEKEFDLTEVDDKLKQFEAYIDFVEDVVENVEEKAIYEDSILPDGLIEQPNNEDVKLDAFGNPIE